MKPIHLALFVLFSTQFSSAQIYEVGVFGGGSNFIGDVGSTRFIAPVNAAYGGLVKWNRSARHSYRASFIYTNLEADDRLADDPRRVNRKYSFTAPSYEISLGMEFTFLEFDLHQGLPNQTPYIYTGISVLNHPNFYYLNNRLVSEKKRSNAIGIPIVLGFKKAVDEFWIAGIEAGARYTFSDELDGSDHSSAVLKEIVRFGNFNNNDWYMFVGLTLTYTFGRKPCYCNL
jgi:hypothetical protein